MHLETCYGTRGPEGKEWVLPGEGGSGKDELKMDRMVVRQAAMSPLCVAGQWGWDSLNLGKSVVGAGDERGQALLAKIRPSNAGQFLRFLLCSLSS